jgi:hypothetical protein
MDWHNFLSRAGSVFSPAAVERIVFASPEMSSEFHRNIPANGAFRQ